MGKLTKQLMFNVSGTETKMDSPSGFEIRNV